METRPSDLVLKVAKESIDLAMKCVATGETLLAFIQTEGTPDAIISLAGKSFAEVLAMAQEQVGKFGAETTAFAFAYDGFITVKEERNDCVYVEAAEVGGDRLFIFAQQYHPKRFLRPVKRIGNWMCLENSPTKLKWKAKRSGGG